MGAENQALRGPHGSPSTEDKRKRSWATAKVCFYKERDKLHMLPQARRHSVPAHWGIQLNSSHPAQHPLPLQSCWSRTQRLPEAQEVPGN